MPILSIITPTYNRHHLLDNALSCLAEQTFQDYELIIINDGGEPVSNVIKKWENKLDIKSIDLIGRNGPSVARNRGIEISEGKYLSFLDDDDIYLPNHLSNLVEVLERGNMDFVYSGAIISPERVECFPSNIEQCIIMNNQFNPSFLYVMCYIPVASIVCKNFKKNGYSFNEQLSYCEDWEMWLHLCKEGYIFEHVSDITAIYHRIPVSNNLSFESISTIKAYENVYHAWEKVIDLYPTDDSLINIYRKYMLQFHQACLEKLERKEKIGHFAFEKFTKFLLDQFNKGNSIGNLSNILKDLL